jgi:hypothetical protein
MILSTTHIGRIGRGSDQPSKFSEVTWPESQLLRRVDSNQHLSTFQAIQSYRFATTRFALSKRDQVGNTAHKITHTRTGESNSIRLCEGAVGIIAGGWGGAKGRTRHGHEESHRQNVHEGRPQCESFTKVISSEKRRTGQGEMEADCGYSSY